MVISARVMILFFMNFPPSSPLPTGEEIFLESKIKKTTAKNQLGYENGDRTWYPTLFGSEKRKRLAYFISDLQRGARFRVSGSEFRVNAKAKNFKLETAFCLSQS
jgi:hypothetical protein